LTGNGTHTHPLLLNHPAQSNPHQAENPKLQARREEGNKGLPWRKRVNGDPEKGRRERIS